jgi:hypothetical protein
MVQISTTPWSEDLTKRGCIALTDCALFERLTNKHFFLNATGFSRPGLRSAGIFLAHAIDAYQAESAGPKAPGDSDQ